MTRPQKPAREVAQCGPVASPVGRVRLAAGVYEKAKQNYEAAIRLRQEVRPAGDGLAAGAIQLRDVTRRTGITFRHNEGTGRHRAKR